MEQQFMNSIKYCILLVTSQCFQHRVIFISALVVNMARNEISVALSCLLHGFDNICKVKWQNKSFLRL